MGRLQPRSWTAEDGSARSAVEVVAEELGGEPALGDGDNDQDDEELRLWPGRPLVLDLNPFQAPGLPVLSPPGADRGTERGLHEGFVGHES